ncbi:acyltransferase family protein [Fimbriiglobus ruber]|uniref:Acyltransferase n=1 Tax=Fimbriiglobus ruber TaxID=1908690 RepID=A0A225DZ10_9BACT|nr:acyltransferase [Fimbriiglobus ruber]OWK42996.1 Acyltransferase [Fimbriiglobus ruber]
MGRPAREIRSLTGLRAVAAGAVAFAHVPWLHHSLKPGSQTRHLLEEGFIGVPFFFVLSGFVLAYTYHDRFPALDRRTLAGYFVARAARIYPVHWLTLALAVGIALATARPGDFASRLGPFVANATLTHAWVPDLDYIQSFNSVSWTLSIEVFFYLCLPALVWAAGRVRTGVLVGAAAAACAAQAGAVAACVADPFGLPDVWKLWLANVCPLTRLGEFAAGVALGVQFARAGPGKPGSGLRGRIVWTALEVAAAAVVFLMMKWSSGVPMLLRLSGYYPPAMAVLVALYARERGYFSALLGGRVPVYLGGISFSFYMLHGLVFGQTERWVGTATVGAYGLTAICLAAAVGGAALVHGLFEAPVREAVVRRFRNRDTTRPQT